MNKSSYSITMARQAVGDVGKMREELLPVVKKEYADYRRRMDNYRMQVHSNWITTARRFIVIE